MARDPNKGSELGGTSGLIQPAPHEATPSETLIQIYATEPSPPALIGDLPANDYIPTTRKVR